MNFDKWFVPVLLSAFLLAGCQSSPPAPEWTKTPRTHKSSNGNIVKLASSKYSGEFPPPSLKREINEQAKNKIRSIVSPRVESMVKNYALQLGELQGKEIIIKGLQREDFKTNLVKKIMGEVKLSDSFDDKKTKQYYSLATLDLEVFLYHIREQIQFQVEKATSPNSKKLAQERLDKMISREKGKLMAKYGS